MLSRAKLACGLLLASLWSGCARDADVRSPRNTLDSYAAALQSGRLRDAYDLLSDEAKKSITFEAFQRIVQENPEEIREIAVALGRPSGAALVTATVTTPSGKRLLLVLEDGKWRIDGSSIDLYSQATPESTVVAFVRAFENKRYDILMRFVPDAEREGLDAKRLRAAWEGEQRDEMVRLTQALKAALPTARFELLGDRATMAYGASGTVELVRESGAWKIEELK